VTQGDDLDLESCPRFQYGVERAKHSEENIDHASFVASGINQRRSIIAVCSLFLVGTGAAPLPKT